MEGNSLEMGIVAEARYCTTRLNWTTDETNTLSLLPKYSAGSDATLNDAHNWNLLRYRFGKTKQYGFTIYSLPNSGMDFECAYLAPLLRAFMGNSVSIYYGYGMDVAAPFVGFHTVADYSASTEWTYRTPLWFFSLMKWVLDDIDVYAEVGTVTGSPAVSGYEYGFQNRISAWAPVAQSGVLNALQPSYINSGTGQFLA